VTVRADRAGGLLYRIPIKNQGRRAPVREPENASRPIERETEWKDRALRLQAEMDNYRKRQQRNAQGEVRKAEDRLLLEVLSIADNLDRSLAVAKTETSLLQGIEITRDEVLQLLRGYGVELVRADRQPFDPQWHEAVDVVSATSVGLEPGTVAEVRQSGYRRGGQLLRPARVVVAQ
jgi:molecular chaperone GrpE